MKSFNVKSKKLLLTFTKLSGIIRMVISYTAYRMKALKFS